MCHPNQTRTSMIRSQALIKGLRDRFPPTRQIQKRTQTVGITLTFNKIKSIIYIVLSWSTLTNFLCSKTNKTNSWRPAAYSSATTRSAISRTAAWLASHSASEQSSGTLSPTGSRSASGRWVFTRPRVCCTASLVAPPMQASSRPRDASSLSARLSAAVGAL